MLSVPLPGKTSQNDPLCVDRDVKQLIYLPTTLVYVCLDYYVWPRYQVCGSLWVCDAA